MKSVLCFSPEENLRRVEMDRMTKYVIVEGEEVAVYEAILDSRLGTNFRSREWEVVSGGSKPHCLEFSRNCSGDHFLIIVDRDFDTVDCSDGNSRVVVLKRYSIENYLFDDAVVCPVVAFVLGLSRRKIDGEFTIGDLKNHYKECLHELGSLVYSYQTSVREKRISWSGRSILRRGCWRILEDRVIELRDAIRDAIGCTNESHTLSKDDFFVSFPCKMICAGIYFYVRSQISGFAERKINKKLPAEGAFRSQLLANLVYSEDLAEDLAGVLLFLEGA